MDKLTMAHEYVMNYMASPDCKDTTVSNIVSAAWSYADAMQAEADKREVSIAELMKDHVHDYIYGRICACGAVNGVEEEWQPDWSQAPSWANYWMMAHGGTANWLSDHPSSDPLKAKVWGAPSFGYTGNWQDSLRKRPQ